MERLKTYTLRELIERKDIPREEAHKQIEAAYRRGCHQTAARIFDNLVGIKSIEQAKRFLSAMERALCQIRVDNENDYPMLLDTALRNAHERMKK